MTKKCYKCKQTKSLDRFYKKASNTTDGLCGSCKECDDKAKVSWRLNNLKKVRSYDRGRYWNKTSKKRKQDNARGRQNRLEMSNEYIRILMTVKSKDLNPEDIPDELVKVYRENLRLKRKLGLTPKLKEVK